MRSLHNPLQRQERLSTSWFGVICNYDGVVVEDTYPAHAQAWCQVAEEMNLPRPLGQVLSRIHGARDEVVSGGLVRQRCVQALLPRAGMAPLLFGTRAQLTRTCPLAAHCHLRR
jgi:hypothetical protein